jgi:signal transduction histidine kinase
MYGQAADSNEVPAKSISLEPDADHLAALAEFAAGAGHEINNPLATIVGRVQQLLRHETDPVRRQALVTIGAQAYRVRDMIGDVMLFARPPVPQLELCTLEHLIQGVLKQWRGTTDRPEVAVVPNPIAAVTLQVDPVQFAVALHELLRNAAEAILPSGGEIRIETVAEANEARIAIHDAGCGFSDVERRHAFDPFYSGRQAGRGLGFGLCKVWRIVTAHGGRIAIESAVGGPTVVTTWWPTA